MAFDLLKELIARPSVTPHDSGCQELIASRLDAAGFQVTPMPSRGVENLWATHGDGAPLICLAGHTDVVPPGPREAWTTDPFLPFERDGRLYGRGASDMKGSVAAMIVAIERIAARGHRGTVALLLTSDEEGPAVAGTRHVLDELASRGVQIDGAIVGEPTSEREFGDTVKSGRRGSMTGRLTVVGIQGHTAYPQFARNAVHRLVPALADIVSADLGAGTADFPATTLQVSDLHAGTGASNVIPGHAEVRFNVRFGTDWTADALQDRIGDIVRTHGITEPIQWHVGAEPFLTSPGPLLDTLASVVAAETGVSPNTSTAGGTSDARFFAAHGIPVGEFGPLNASIHAADEHIEIACLEPLTRVYERAVTSLLGG